MTVRLNHAKTTNLQRYEVYVSLDEKKRQELQGHEMNGAAGNTTYMETRNRNPSTENTAKKKTNKQKCSGLFRSGH